MAAAAGKITDETLTITKTPSGDYSIEPGNESAIEENGATYASTVKTINAAKAKANLEVDISGTALTSFTGGSGNDTYNVKKNGVTITTGAGKDVIVVSSDIGDVTIADFDGTKDVVVLEGFDKDNLSFEDYSFNGKDVIVNLSVYQDEVDEETDSTTTKLVSTTVVTFTGAKDKLIKFAESADAEEPLFQQSFQIGRNDEYDATNANTGSVLVTPAKYIDASKRTKSIYIESTGTTGKEHVIGGKAVDTLAATGTASMTGGAGNDIFTVKEGNNLILTDYTFGGNEEIRLADGLEYDDDFEIVGSNVRFYFKTGDTKRAASVLVRNGLWNQITASAKSKIKITDADGGESYLDGAVKDPSHLYVTTLSKNKADNVFDLSTAENLGSGFNLDSKVQKITFTAAGAVKLTGGGGYTQITNGKGADTIYGAAAVNSDDAEPITITEVIANTEADEDGEGGVEYFKYLTHTELKDEKNIITGRSFTYSATVNEETFKVVVTVTLDEVEEGEDRTAKITAMNAIDGDGESAGDITVETGASAWALTGSLEGITLNFDFDTLAGLVFEADDIGNDSSKVAATANELFSWLFGEKGGGGLSVTYTFDPSLTNYIAGAGNDILYSNVGGGKFHGGDGADTLTGGVGNSTLYGDGSGKKKAGNDTFLLTGEGTDTSKVITTTVTDEESEEEKTVKTYTTVHTQHVIQDYYSGFEFIDSDESSEEKKTRTANQKDNKTKYGTDKIVVANSSYKDKVLAEGISAKASVIGGSLIKLNEDDDNSYLSITVAGSAWHDSVGESVDDDDFQPADFNDTYTTANYVFKSLTNGTIINIVDQGVTYKQVVSEDSSVTIDKNNYSNYNGLLNNNVTSISVAEGNTKAQRIVAGNATTAITGGKGKDTIIGNGQTTMTGGEGADIFIVKAGDSIADYSDGKVAVKGEANLGKDTIRLAAGMTFHDLNDIETPASRKETNIATNTSIALVGEPSDGQYEMTITLGNDDKFVISIQQEGTTYTITEINPVEVEGEEEGGNNSRYSYPYLQNVVGESFTTLSAASVLEVLTGVWTENITYDVAAVKKTMPDGSEMNNDASGDDVMIGGIALAGVGGENAKNVTITQVTETKVEGTGKNIGKYTGTKSVTNTMIRKFDGTETLTGGNGNYLEVYNGVDDNVKVVKAANKASTIVNSANSVESIVAGNSHDTIYAGTNTSGKSIYVNLGKSGKDVLVWNGSQNVVVDSFDTVVLNNKNVINKGDVIVLDGFTQSDLTKSFDGDDVILTANTTGKRGTLTIKNGKGKTAYIYSKSEESGDFNSAAAIDVESDGYMTFINDNELILAKNEKFEDVSSNLGEKTIVNASASNKAQIINLADTAVKTLYGSKAADTVYAGDSTTYIDGGAAADVIFAGKALNQTITGGAAADIFAFNANSITSGSKVTITDYVVGTDKIYLSDGLYIQSAVASGFDDEEAENDYVVTVKGGTTHIYSDVTLTLANASGDTYTVLLQKVEQESISSKGKVTPLGNITVVRESTGNPAAKTAKSFSLDYGSSEISIGGGKNGTYFDLHGISASSVTVAKAAKNVTVEAAPSGTSVSVENGMAEKSPTKNPVVFIGNEVKDAYVYNTAYIATVVGSTNTFMDINTIVGGAFFTGNDDLYTDATGSTKMFEDGYKNGAVTYYGSAGNDIYVGNGAWDSVNLGAGNDTFKAGNENVVRAVVTSGEGKNTFVVGMGDAYTVKGFSSSDQIVVGEDVTAFGSYYDASAKTLQLTYSTGGTVAGSVVITDYIASEAKKVSVGQFGTNDKGKSVINNLTNFSYGSDTLTVTNDDYDVIEMSTSLNGTATTIVDATARTKANISITGDAIVNKMIGGSKNDTLTFNEAVTDATVTGGAGNDVFIFNAEGPATLTVTDYGTGTDSVSVAKSFGEDFNFDSYTGNYSFSGTDLILIDSSAGTGKETELVFKGVVDETKGTTKAISINGKKNLVFNDPVNVVLTSSTITDFTEGSVSTASAGIKTMNAKNSKKETVKLKTGTEFTEFVANATGTELDMSNNTKAASITGGAGDDKITLGNGKDTYMYNGGNDELSSFGSGDVIEVSGGWSYNKVEVENESALVASLDGSGVADGTAVDLTITFKKSKSYNTLKISGVTGNDAIKFAKTSAGDYTVKVGSTGETYTFKEKEASYLERDYSEYAEVAGFYHDFTEADELSEITGKSVDEAAVSVELKVDYQNSFGADSTTAALTTNKKK